MPRPSRYVDRSTKKFRMRALCQDCDWSRYAYGLRTALCTLQQQAREHAYLDTHKVDLAVWVNTTYTPKDPP
jgi:hypothetical protein